MKDSSAVSLDVPLPTKPTYEGASMQEMIWFIYGPPGIGKSTFVSQCEGVLFLSTDPGLRFLNVMKMKISSWLQFKRIVKHLEANQPRIYKAIAIDTVDPLFMMCRDYICKKRGIEHQSDEPYGKAYELTTAEFHLEISKLVALPYGLFFLSHSKTEEIRGRAMRTSMLKPSLASQGYKVLAPMADIIAYYGFGEESADTKSVERKMQFQPSETVECKDRTKGGLPETLVIPEDGGFKLVEQYLLGIARQDKPKLKKKKKRLLIRHK